MTNNLRVLICGGGCAGPALAFWLARAGHDVTIVERFPALRAAGAQIDLRAQAIDAVTRMGLLDEVRAIRVDEAGMALVDTHDKPKATFLANKSGKGAQSFTSEYEIMRGDLVRVLYNATKDNVKYVFGKTVESFDQDEKSVTAHFSDGTSDNFDILVGADGQGSRIRKAILPPNSPDPIHPLGIFIAYWIVPRNETDTGLCRLFLAPKRWLMCRTHNSTETQAYFAIRANNQELRDITRAPVDEQKEFWAKNFKGVGWQADRFIEGMKDTDNFYCQEVAQVRTSTWSKGRVVLLADAAHCPSPITGMGTTSAFVGAYILAGEICSNTDNLPRAFENYDRVMRPFVKDVQKTSPSAQRLMFPESKFGISIIYLITAMISFLRIADLVSRFSSRENGGWQLPDYPVLKTSSKSDVKEKA